MLSTVVRAFNVYLNENVNCTNATQRNATQRNATQRNATQRNATQRNATRRKITINNNKRTMLSCYSVKAVEITMECAICVFQTVW